jgi:hypothetical protein
VQGYDVVTSDGHKIGQVVEERDDCLIVEHGHVFKAKHAIPKTFTAVDDNEQVVHATITKDVFTDGPKVTGEWDCEAVMHHYGLAETFAEPEDEDATAPAGADDSAVAERAAMREGTAEEPSEPAVHDRSRNALDPTGTTANR